jgi:glutathione S-transferase
MLGRQTDEKLAEKYTANLNAKLEGYERILSKQKYLAGNVSFPLAKLCHLDLRRYPTELYPC